MTEKSPQTSESVSNNGTVKAALITLVGTLVVCGFTYVMEERKLQISKAELLAKYRQFLASKDAEDRKFACDALLPHDLVNQSDCATGPASPTVYVQIMIQDESQLQRATEIVARIGVVPPFQANVLADDAFPSTIEVRYSNSNDRQVAEQYAAQIGEEAMAYQTGNDTSRRGILQIWIPVQIDETETEQSTEEN